VEILTTEINILDYLGGVVLALLTTICFNYAPLLLKKGLNQMEAISTKNLLASIKRMITNRYWLEGIGVTLLGGVLYFIALNIAGVTIVQPLLNFGFIVLVIMARRMLGEKLDQKAKVAIAILITMPFFISLGQVTPPTTLSNPATMVWFSIACIIATCVAYVVSRKILILWAITTGIILGLNAAYEQWFSVTFFGAWAARGNILVAAWVAIIPIVCMVVGTVAGFFINQVGLQKNLASRFNPINGTTNVLLGLFGGILLFGQTVTNWWFYGIGVVMGIAGVILLSKYQIDSMTPPPSQEKSKDAEPPAGEYIITSADDQHGLEDDEPKMNKAEDGLEIDQD